MPENTAFSTFSLALAVTATTLFMALYFTGSPWFAWLNLEDGAVEWATVILSLLAAAAALCSARCRRAKPARIAVALVFFAFAGEEISWGQRIFMFATPEPLAAINVQSEFTFHNIEGVHGNIRAVCILLLILAFVVAPVLSRRSGLCRTLVERVNLPFFDRDGLAVLGIAMLLMAVPRAVGSPTVFDEFGELLMALSGLVYARLMAGHGASLHSSGRTLRGTMRSTGTDAPSGMSQPTRLLR